MKRHAWFFALVLAAGFFAISAELPTVFGWSSTAEVTLKGEVVDLHCYITRHGGEGRGPQHAGCANACLSRGVTAGFVASDGKLYLLFDEKPFPVKEKIAGLAGQQVTLTGTIAERDGVRGILLKSVEPAN